MSFTNRVVKPFRCILKDEICPVATHFCSFSGEPKCPSEVFEQKWTSFQTTLCKETLGSGGGGTGLEQNMSFGAGAPALLCV